jgi:hypothetical protein
MRLPALAILLCFSTGIFSGCKKTVVEEIYKDTIITDNDIPDYSGVTDLQITTYINKIYIDLFGYEASGDELEEGLLYLEQNNLNEASRDTLIQQLINKTDYTKRLWLIASIDFINGVDSITIAEQVLLFEFLWVLDSLNGNYQNQIFYDNEIQKCTNLMNAHLLLHDGLVTYNEFFAFFMQNFFYDQVNMGSENFVKAAFDDLFLREPTESELETGVNMVDNQPSSLFLIEGDSKGDFVSIVTTVNEYYEGLVKKIYKQLLLRDPTSTEIAAGVELLLTTHTYDSFQKKLMISDEYAGF